MSLKQLFYKARYGGLPVLLNKNALFKAVETGNMHLTNHLLTKANVDNQDKSGNTALHYAVKNNRHDMAEMLLKWGAKPNIANDNGMTASDIGIANVIFARLCMQPLLENHDFKMTSTDSLVDAVRWHIGTVAR
ncbi:ankyrin repeat domain-containing protein [Candidatus Tisiphia endosymbiont of Sialis lutaria]|uniref:ankyrin repeat domain-containing protein n=1 Tax=Candidatus Tisiphia endosymbiont of Sialis lutaria TaxID=2029164 RepID=UPI00312CA8A2